MQTNTYEGLHIIKKKQSITTDELVIEAPLQININTEPYTVVMRTPGNDQDLVLGLLYAEDIYKKTLPIPFKVIEEKFNIPSIINVTITPSVLGKGYLNKRTLLSVSSCGICGKQQLEDIKVSGDKIEKKINFSSENLLKMFAPLQKEQETFKKSRFTENTVDNNTEQVVNDVNKTEDNSKKIENQKFEESTLEKN